MEQGRPTTPVTPAAGSPAGEPGSGRAGHPVLTLLLELIARRPVSSPPRVLDCGGGSGWFATPLAAAGAHVTVIDVSADALATLRRRADEAGVSDRVTAVQGDVVELAGLVAPDRFDLVLAHGVLEALHDPSGGAGIGAGFAAMASVLAPHGRLSVLITNPVAGVLARALAGDLPAALADLRALDADFAHPGPDAVRELCRQHGLLVEAVHGVGVFSELVPGAALDQPGARDALDALEAETATRRPFSDIAARVHVLAHRPD